MIKFAVLDDEKIYLDMISNLLAMYKQEKNVQIEAELFSNAKQLLEKETLDEKEFEEMMNEVRSRRTFDNWDNEG